MEQEKYIKSVAKKLKCRKQKKQEIIKQLESDFNIALESGESLNAVLERMGTPEELAAEFNDNLPEEVKNKAKRAKIFKILAAAAAVLLIIGAAGFWMLPKYQEIGKSGFFQAEEVEEQAKEIIRLVSKKEFGALADGAADAMVPYLTAEKIEPVMQQLSPEWGEFISYGNAYLAEMAQMGKTYAMIQINVSYENVSITYTLLFDKEMKLAGLYLK